MRHRAAPPSESSRHRQQGVALMIMMLILILGAAALFVRDLGGRSATTARITQSAAALAAAKQALLGAIVTADSTSPGNLGALPCPDINAGGGFAEGAAHTTACLARYRSALGRLPWRTLGIDPGRVRGAECLWYAVSGTWKHATAAPSELLNTDTNGLFRIFAGNGTTLLAGATPAERAVAVIIAPGALRPGQVRTTPAAGSEQCGGNYTAANYLDRDTVTGINNADLASAANAVDDFMVADASRDDFNDQVLWITRADIEAELARRADLQAKWSALTFAVAKCIADYGRRNAAGVADRRLPWPAPLVLAQYRSDSQYNDTPVGWLSGRVADRVNDSNAATGNPTARVLTNCSTAAVPEWTAENAALWRHWKDHLFYAVAGSFSPSAAPHSSCGTCLRVNGAGSWAAVVLFSGPRLAALSQVRDEPPTDADTRGTLANYLEGRNATNHPNAGGAADYESGVATPNFNDVLYCVDSALAVVSC